MSPALQILRGVRASLAATSVRRTPRSLAAALLTVTTVGALVTTGCADRVTGVPDPIALNGAPAYSTGTWQGSASSGTLTTRLNSGLCMDVLGGAVNAGTRIGIWSCNGGANQQFVWQPNGEIRSGSLCVDAAGGSGNSGDAIMVWTCNGGNNQRWSGTSDGQIRGINGRCIDIPGGNTTLGTTLILWDCNGGNNQNWDEHTAGTSGAPIPPAPTPVAPVTGSAAAVLAFMAASNVPSVATQQGRGGTWAQYENDFTRYADTQWASDEVSQDANYYDRAMIYYVWWARTGNATYLDRANKMAIAARSYIESTNYNPQPYLMMLDGVALHALVTGDQRSATAVAKVADVMAKPNGGWQYIVSTTSSNDGDNRTSARVLQAVLDAYLLKVASPSGYDYGSRLRDLLTRILSTQSSDGGYRWANQCGYNKPFMNGMLDDALIRYYTSFEADGRIVPSVKRSVDYLWNSNWFSASNAFTYLEGYCGQTGESGGAPGSADLNNMIASGYAFVAKQTGDASYYTKGDLVFNGGVYGSWLPGKKQFNQEYTSSYRYLALRF